MKAAGGTARGGVGSGAEGGTALKAPTTNLTAVKARGALGGAGLVRGAEGGSRR